MAATPPSEPPPPLPPSGTPDPQRRRLLMVGAGLVVGVALLVGRLLHRPVERLHHPERPDESRCRAVRGPSRDAAVRDQHRGDRTGTRPPLQRQGRGGSGDRERGRGRRGGWRSRALMVGTIQSVSGSQVTVQTGQGPVTLTVGSDAAVRTLTAGSASDLTTGARVLLTGGQRPPTGCARSSSSAPAAEQGPVEPGPVAGRRPRRRPPANRVPRGGPSARSRPDRGDPIGLGPDGGPSPAPLGYRARVTSRAGRRRERRVTRRRVVGVAVVVVVAVGAAGWFVLLSGVGQSGSRTVRTVRATTTTSTSTTLPPTTTTTVDPGTLPQTMDMPTTTEPAVPSRPRRVLAGDRHDNPAPAMPFFFPLSAYVQVKAISNPASDWQQPPRRRLSDRHPHAAPLCSAPVRRRPSSPASTCRPPPSGCSPGAEYNKGSYWRVYSSQVHYTVDGQAGSFTIASMISWRGEWYIVHLASIQ